MWGKTNLHQDKILLPLTCLPFSPPISLPLLIHTRPIPIPHTFRSQPTHLLPPSHSPSVRSPLSFRPQPTLPSPLLIELVHLLPCLLLQATYSPVPPFPLSSYPVNTIYYPLILPLHVNYFYHLTFLSVLV